MVFEGLFGVVCVCDDLFWFDLLIVMNGDFVWFDVCVVWVYVVIVLNMDVVVVVFVGFGIVDCFWVCGVDCCIVFVC